MLKKETERDQTIIDEKRRELRHLMLYLEDALGDKGRVVLRASGTEPVIRVMVEGRDQGQVGQLANQLADVVRQAV